MSAYDFRYTNSSAGPMVNIALGQRGVVLNNVGPSTAEFLKALVEEANTAAALRAQLAEMTKQRDAYKSLQVQMGKTNRALIEARERAEAANDRMETALNEIYQWGLAYPLEVFPEPDFKKANELLHAGGMRIDDISASNMRHVVKRVSEIARAALSTPAQPEEGE